MQGMRALLIAFALAAAPAAAQDLTSPLVQHQLDELRAQQQMAQQRAIAQANELMAMEARLRADQAAAELQARRAPVRLPQLLYDAPASPAAYAAGEGGLPSISDEALAASNARVRAAAQNRR